MRGNAHLFGMAELQFRKHRFRQKPKSCPDYGVRARSFYEKRKRIITWRRKEVSTAGSQQAEFPFSYSGWLFILSSGEESAVPSPRGWIRPSAAVGRSRSDWPSPCSAEARGAGRTRGSSCVTCRSSGAACGQKQVSRRYLQALASWPPSALPWHLTFLATGMPPTRARRQAGHCIHGKTASLIPHSSSFPSTKGRAAVRSLLFLAFHTLLQGREGMD